jgi:hypothetical protein
MLFKRRIIVILITLIAVNCFNLRAQRDYSTGIGIRSWPYWGITAKQFVTEQTALELIVSSKWKGLMIDGLYEFHHNTFNTSNFNLFYGFGGHSGWWSNDSTDHPWLNYGQHITVGLCAIVGIEYSFDEIPFSVSVDWKPLLIIAQHAGVNLENISFSVRYNIK